MVEPVVLKFRLELRSPLAVLTGGELSLFEHYFDRGNKRLFRIDFRLLIERLKEDGALRDFLHFLREFKGSREELHHLYSYYRKYSPFAGSLAVDLDYLPSKIKETVKNPADGLPYIPGSSVKGALRTAILEAVIASCCADRYASEVSRIRNMLRPFKGPPDAWEVDRNEVKRIDRRVIGGAQKELSKVYSRMERELLCEPVEGVNRELFKKPPSKRELFRFIKVSDFMAEGDVEVRVGLLKRRYRDGSPLRRNLQVALEYINRGVFKGEIRLYPEYLESFLSCRIKISKDRIVSELGRRGRELLEKERKVFKAVYSYFPFSFPQGSIPVKLGFGGGALSKTFLDDRLRLVGNRITGFRTIPHTISLINSRPAGWCLLTLEE